MAQTVIESIKGSKVKVYDNLNAYGTGKFKDFDLYELLAINENDISQEFIKQPALYGYFAALLAHAEQTLATLKNAQERAYSNADLEIREDLEGKAQRNPKFKTTEGMVKSMAQLDSEYIQYSDDIVASQYDVALLKSITYALQQRAEMLVSLGAQIRHEIDQTGLSIREARMDKSLDNVKQVIRNSKK